MRRHAHHVSGAGLDYPVERLFADRKIVHNDFKAGNKALLDGNGADVMRQRAVAEQDRFVIVMPVLDHRAAVREQRVVRMQHAFRHAGRAGSESKVNNLVRVEVGFGQSAGFAAKRGELCIFVLRRRRSRRKHAVYALHRRQRLRRREHIRAVGIRTISRLREQHRRLYAVEQLGNFVDRVILVQRRIAHVAVARAGEKHHRRFDAVGQPHGHPLAALQTCRLHFGRERIDPLRQLRPRDAPRAIAQRVSLRASTRVSEQQRIKRIAAPHAVRVILAGGLRIVEGEYGAHELRGEARGERREAASGSSAKSNFTPLPSRLSAQCPNLSVSGLRFSRIEAPNSLDSSVSR